VDRPRRRRDGAAQPGQFGAEVLMLSDEDCEPYEKPPLSKALLTGKAMPLRRRSPGPAGSPARHHA